MYVRVWKRNYEKKKDTMHRGCEKKNKEMILKEHEREGYEKLKDFHCDEKYISNNKKIYIKNREKFQNLLNIVLKCYI